LGGSCGAPVCVRWRAEKQLSRCKAFDDVHGSAAERALRKDHGWLGFVGGLFNSGLMDRTAKQPETERQQCGTLAVGKEAEVTDAHEAAWQQVQEEATQELIVRQAHDSLLVAVGGVSPAEADLAVGEGDQPAVGDADAMGLCTEVAQGMFRSTEGLLRVDDPVMAEQESEPGGEVAWLSER
jgi:hypothetical protein